MAIRRTPIRKVGKKQAAKNREWSALKLARIKRKIDSQGFVKCERCPKAYSEVKTAVAYLQAHHKDQRSLGGAYTDANMSLLCNACHDLEDSAESLREQHAKPRQWTGKVLS